VDRRVVEPVGAKLVGVGGTDRCRSEGQLARVVAERPCPVVELRVAVVVLGVRRKLVWGALVTEVVGVRAPSVITVVRR
jgi:hypothetical protein